MNDEPKRDDGEDELWKVPRVCKRLAFSRSALYGLLGKPGGLPFVRIGGSVRVKRSDVEALIERCTINPGE